MRELVNLVIANQFRILCKSEVEEAQREVKVAQQTLKNYEQLTKQIDLAKDNLKRIRLKQH